MDIDPAIYFLIVVPDARPDEASPMQGFAPSLCRNNWLVERAALLPTTVYDLTTAGRETLLARRVSGTFPVNWYGQSPIALRSYPQPISIPFAFILLTEQEAPEEYETWIASSAMRPTIVKPLWPSQVPR